jgi:hypothetical protein
MPPELVRVLITAALLLHGVAHGKAFFELLGDAAATGNRATVPVRSWLRPSLSRRTAALLASPFWLVSAVGFIVASLSFWGILHTSDVWRQTAAVSCAVSTLGLILFCEIWPGAPNRNLSALDVAIAMVMNAGIVVLLAAGWPPEAMFGK